MSDNFPNLVQNATEQPMGVGMYNPDPNTPDQSAGGKTKIQKSADAPHPTEMEGYGYMSPELKDVGTAPSGENSSGIPAAQPITPMTFGDPAGTALDADDADLKGGHL